MGLLKLAAVAFFGLMLVGIAWRGNATKAWQVLTAPDPDKLGS